MIAKRLFWIFFVSLWTTVSWAQISTHESPLSLSLTGLNELRALLNITTSNVPTTAKNNGQYKNLPCGFVINSEINIDSHGQTDFLATENAYLWRLKLNVNHANAINLYANEFYLSTNSKMYVYSADYMHQLGAFTSENNQKDLSFSTAYIPSGTVVLEIYSPVDEWHLNKLNIDGVGVLYDGIAEYEPSVQRDFGDSQECQVNVNCPEGDGYDGIKNAVVRILVRSGSELFWCSGTLINSYQNTCKPYIITAEHCAAGATASNLNQWMFYFNYESPTCDNPAVEGILAQQTVRGCSLKANSTTEGDEDSDFYLVELNSEIPNTYFPFYAGWSRATVLPDSCFVIHHPNGDIKKISKSRFAPKSASWGGVVAQTHWEVNWKSTPNGHGTTEQGSSGSGLFDAYGMLVGTLTGGSSSCDSPNSPDYFGRFDFHWNKIGTASNRRADVWLDPFGNNPTSIDGRRQCWALGEALHVTAPQITVFPNPTTQFLHLNETDFLDAAYQIISTDGKVVLSGTTRAGIGIDVSSLADGIYFLNIKSKQETTTIPFSKY